MKAIFWNLVKIRKLKQKCYTSSEVGNFRWGHALICSGLAWILGFNGLLAKEAGGRRQSLEPDHDGRSQRPLP